MPLGKDLASIRKSQNLTLEDIQNAIKIPLSTLQSIEDESIFHSHAENPTYRRSFIRSYAKILKIEDDKIVKALDAMEAGTYQGNLFSGSETEEEPEPTESDFIEEGKEEGIESTFTPPVSEKPKKAKPPEINSVNWADMGRKFSPVGRNSRNVLVLIILISVSLLAGAGYIFSDEIMDFISNTTPADELQADAGEPAIQPAPIDSANVYLEETESDRTSAESRDEPIVLGDTLTVAVYAAYGQLEPVRVTSDLNWRTNPYWMEEGEAYNFDFNDTLLVRGQYSRMLLLFNGHPIDNPRQNHFNNSYNSILITRADLNQSRYLTPPPQEFPLDIGAPDTIEYRLRF
ncbi:MAG: helix-turn-helix domain-containing protein [Balneolaceae bacterium]